MAAAAIVMVLALRLGSDTSEASASGTEQSTFSLTSPILPVPSPAPSPSPPNERAIEDLQRQLTELRRKLDKPPKDLWDKITALSGLASGIAVLASGIAVALIGFYATNVYTRSQKAADARRAEDLVVIQRIQTVEKFMPHLASGEEQMKKAALIAISALGNDQLAIQLADALRGTGATSALTTIATTSGLDSSASAQRALADVLKYYEHLVVTVNAGKDAAVRRVATGFIVDAGGGLIVTTAHAVAPVPTNEIMVGLAGGGVIEAHLLKTDIIHDLALLSVAPSEALRALHITPTVTVPRAYSRITALLIDGRGNRRLEFGTVLGWDVALPRGYNPFLQTHIFVDLNVEPGDSGSAVVDDEGRLLGVICERTAPGSVPEFVSLISADEVRAFAAEGQSSVVEPGLQKS